MICTKSYKHSKGAEVPCSPEDLPENKILCVLTDFFVLRQKKELYYFNTYGGFNYQGEHHPIGYVSCVHTISPPGTVAILIQKDVEK